MRSFQRGREAEENSGNDGNDQSEEQDARVHAHVTRARQSAGKNGKSGAGSPCSNEQAERTAANRKKNTFGEQLAHHAALTGAERCANGEFTRASGGAREKQVGDVDARDEQNESDGGKQDEQERLDALHHFLFYGRDGDAAIFVSVGIGDGEIVSDGGHVRARLRERDALLDASHAINAGMDFAVAEERILRGAERYVHVAGTEINVATAKVEIGGQHADDGVVGAVEIHGFADDVTRGSEFGFPERRAEDDGRRGAELVFGGSKIAAKRGGNAKSGEKVVGSLHGGDALRVALARPGEALKRFVAGERGESVTVADPVDEVGIGDGAFAAFRKPAGDGYDLVRVRIGQGIEKHSVDDGEERGVRADAERESEDGD